MTRRYRAFISYSWADKAWAAWLHRSLETYRTPKGLIGTETTLGSVPSRLHPIFRDRDEQAAGHGISAAIEAAMADSDFMIVICSPRAVRSQWVNTEIAWFKRHRTKERILALVIDGEPGVSLRQGTRPLESPHECFPPTLLYQVDERLQPTERVEDLPLAADARRSGDGKRLARLKLAAALLGLGLGTLVKRDERRRASRVRWGLTVMGSITAVMTTLAIVALQQRDLAREMQTTAEVQRNQAEGLVEFMIDDLRHKLEDDVQLEVMADIAIRAQDYYAIQTDVRMDDDALARRARVLDLLGDLKQDFGDSSAAAELLRESAAASAELLRRDPENPQRIIERAHSIQGLGSLSYQRGEIDEAETLMREAVLLTERLRILEPDNQEWLGEHGSALVNLGAMRLNANAIDEAVDSFREAVRIKRTALDHAHSLASARYDLSLTLAWLARALLLQGDVDGAHRAWQDEEFVIAQILDADAVNYPALRRRALNRLNRAEAFGHQQNHEVALELAQLALEDAEDFMGANSSDARGMETAARAQLVLGNSLLMLKQLASASAASMQAAELVDRLVDIDGERYQWSGQLKGSERVLATLLAAGSATNMDDCQLALASIGPESERLRTLSDSHPADKKLATVVAQVYLIRGDAAALAGDSGKAQEFWSLAADRLRMGGENSPPTDPARHRIARELERRSLKRGADLNETRCGRSPARSVT